MKYCSIEGCLIVVKFRKLCKKHYTAQWRKDNPDKWKKQYDRANKIRYIRHKDLILQYTGRYQKTPKGKLVHFLSNKKYLQTKKGKEMKILSAKEYRQRNPERCKAHSLAKKIPRTPCVICGNPRSHRHHPDIKKPLEVIMLCPKHHVEAHKNL